MPLLLPISNSPSTESTDRREAHWLYYLLDDPADVLQLECLDVALSMATVFEDVFSL
ncbi:MAG: hypothetical protein ACPG47_04355 [Leucothrix sp.]